MAFEGATAAVEGSDLTQLQSVVREGLERLLCGIMIPRHKIKERTAHISILLVISSKIVLLSCFLILFVPRVHMELDCILHVCAMDVALVEYVEDVEVILVDDANGPRWQINSRRTSARAKLTQLGRLTIIIALIFIFLFVILGCKQPIGSSYTIVWRQLRCALL